MLLGLVRVWRRVRVWQGRLTTPAPGAGAPRDVDNRRKSFRLINTFPGRAECLEQLPTAPSNRTLPAVLQSRAVDNPIGSSRQRDREVGCQAPGRQCSGS